MSAAKPPRSWCCRPSLLGARMFCLALAMLAVLAGFVLSLAFDETLWMVGMVLLAMWLGLQGGPLLLRLMEKGGWFGRIRVVDGRLQLGRASRAVDLAGPLEVEARFQRSTIRREYNMRDIMYHWAWRPTRRRERNYELGVSVFTLSIEQEGRRFYVAADETSRRPGRDYSLEGLNVRRVAIGPLGGRAVRLWPADAAEILALLQEAEDYSPTTSPVPDRELEDPRKAICPTWKVAAGVAAVLLTSLVLAVGVFSHFQAKHRQQTADMKEAAATEGERREARAQALIGRRVIIPASDEVRMLGRVTGFKMKEDTDYYPEYQVEYRAELTVEIDALHDGDGSPMPEGAEVIFRHADDIVTVGSTVEVDLDEVQEADDPSPAPDEATTVPAAGSSSANR